jgi:NAD(P)-dependent dehydrogenase (short-subunit alcohol dehydrogenase family)
MDTESWDRILDINLKGTFLFCLEASKQMIKQGRGGSIINIGSISAFNPQFGLLAYDTSKVGLWTLTRTLALELSLYSIRVNSISPGPIETEGVSSPEAKEKARRRLYRVAMGRLGTPDEIGSVCLFLASPASSYVTGSNINVDGGHSLTCCCVLPSWP